MHHLKTNIIQYTEILTNSDSQTHFRLNIKKRASCNKKVLQIKFNYNIYISKSQVKCR